MHRASLFFAAFCLACSGGGGSAGSGSCTATSTSGMFTTRVCSEATGLTADQLAALRSTCNASGDGGTPIGDSGLSVTTMSMFSDGTCERSGVIGGCRIASGSFMSTVWYYDGSIYTREGVMAGCTSANGTFVEP